MTGFETPPTFKVHVRILLAIFKNLASIQAASLSLQSKEDAFVVTLECQHSVAKEYRIHYEETGSLKAQHSPDDQCNCFFNIEPRQLCAIIANLGAKVDKVTFIPQADRLHVRSSVEDEDIGSNLNTSCSIDTRDFHRYVLKAQPGTTFSKTFQLKEFKALLNFCEANQLPFLVYFGRGGEPILFETKAPDDSRAFDASLLVAAFDELDGDTPSAGQGGRDTSELRSQGTSIHSFSTSSVKRNRTPSHLASASASESPARSTFSRESPPPNRLSPHPHIQSASSYNQQQDSEGLMDTGPAPHEEHHGDYRGGFQQNRNLGHNTSDVSETPSQNYHKKRRTEDGPDHVSTSTKSTPTSSRGSYQAHKSVSSSSSHGVVPQQSPQQRHDYRFGNEQQNQHTGPVADFHHHDFNEQQDSANLADSPQEYAHQPQPMQVEISSSSLDRTTTTTGESPPKSFSGRRVSGGSAFSTSTTSHKTLPPTPSTSSFQHKRVSNASSIPPTPSTGQVPTNDPPPALQRVDEDVMVEDFDDSFDQQYVEPSPSPERSPPRAEESYSF
eukprot:TRINITY_DN54383_c0_g1_i1.p1 TRINITY_DN54383_c0_g1~~TRINITY_DN54383_c0_g1_i1.p1  ORF type:complete len:635 (-),score=57.81 TRINITY_DN54383_c0_g1_i1:73-1740(-)